jgi:tetratricopeptide (TPR) repeat protein
MVLGTALGPAEGESVLRQGIAALEPLTRGPMPLATAAVQLGGCWCNLGNLRTTAGDLPGALEAYDQAQGILRPLAEEAGPASARAFLANTLRGRALALGRLGRHAEVLADLDRSRALGGATEPAMRFLRAWTLGQVGRHTEAGLEGNALLAHDPRPEARLAVAGLWAQAAAATAAAPDLAEAYAARAVDLVREAQARGYRQWEVLRRDPALAPLRDRPDFRALVGPEP